MLKCSVVDRQVVHEEVPNGQVGGGEVLPMQLKVDCRALDLVDVATAKEVEKTGLANGTKVWTILNKLSNHG